MARGITENDVWTASDALLLEGARPTIERVRQKLGRGSPNTVSPYLDTWFKHLGGRITNPGAFSAQATPPDPIVQAAQRCWDVARAETRRDFDERLNTALAVSVAHVQVEKDRAHLAEIAAFDATATAEHIAATLRERSSELDQERLSAARAAVHLTDAQRQIDDLTSRLDAAQIQLTDAREAFRQESAATVERYNGAVRRALLDIDAERTLRAKADKRVEALERKLDTSSAEARAFELSTAQISATTKGELTRLGRELETALALASEVKRQVEDLKQALVAEQRAADLARVEASVARSLLTQLGKKPGRPAAWLRQGKPVP